ncbi:hypothetical protein [Zhihengliuella halotolerans]|uniref:hypothetical protein n=1 Tax=Zhihengliuella halotolerans TaxID=370736 RepID=UPI0011AFB3DF|nr:hypothetical protein [Zhihengliuella halotolerans]
MNSTTAPYVPSSVLSVEETVEHSGVAVEHIRRFANLGLLPPAQCGAGGELYFSADTPAFAVLRLMELYGSTISELRTIAAHLDGLRLATTGPHNQRVAEYLRAIARELDRSTSVTTDEEASRIRAGLIEYCHTADDGGQSSAEAV